MQARGTFASRLSCQTPEKLGQTSHGSLTGHVEDTKFKVTQRNKKSTNEQTHVFTLPEVNGSTSSANIHINKMRIRTIFDSGSKIGCLRSEIFDRIPKTHKSRLVESDVEATSVTQGQLDIIGKSTIKFKLGKQETAHCMYIIKNLKPSAILGTKFFK